MTISSVASLPSNDVQEGNSSPVVIGLSVQKNLTQIETDLYEFRSANETALPIALVEFVLWPPRQGERKEFCPILPDLRIAQEVISTGKWRITVRLMSVIIESSFSGCTVIRGTRLGDNVHPSMMVSHEVQEKRTSRSTTKGYSAAASVGAKAGIAGDLGLALKGGDESHQNLTQTTETEHLVARVAALPHNRWQISEPEGPLRGTYLGVSAPNGQEVLPLCVVDIISDELLVHFNLLTRPGDLLLEFEKCEETSSWSSSLSSWWRHEKPNKEAVAKLLIQKSCTSSFGKRQLEEFTIARTGLTARRVAKSGAPK